MNRTLAALGGTLALAALAACGPADETTEAATSTSSASSTYSAPNDATIAPSAPTSSAGLPTMTEEDATKAAFLYVLSDAGVNCTPTDCLLAASTVCQFLDEGNKADDLFLELAYNKVMEIDAERIFPFTDNENVPAIVGASIAGYCPEYSYQLDN